MRTMMKRLSKNADNDEATFQKWGQWWSNFPKMQTMMKWLSENADNDEVTFQKCVQFWSDFYSPKYRIRWIVRLESSISMQTYFNIKGCLVPKIYYLIYHVKWPFNKRESGIRLSFLQAKCCSGTENFKCKLHTGTFKNKNLILKHPLLKRETYRLMQLL